MTAKTSWDTKVLQAKTKPYFDTPTYKRNSKMVALFALVPIGTRVLGASRCRMWCFPIGKYKVSNAIIYGGGGGAGSINAGPHHLPLIGAVEAEEPRVPRTLV